MSLFWIILLTVVGTIVYLVLGALVAFGSGSAWETIGFGQRWYSYVFFPVSSVRGRDDLPVPAALMDADGEVGALVYVIGLVFIWPVKLVLNILLGLLAVPTIFIVRMVRKYRNSEPEPSVLNTYDTDGKNIDELRLMIAEIDRRTADTNEAFVDLQEEHDGRLNSLRIARDSAVQRIDGIRRESEQVLEKLSVERAMTSVGTATLIGTPAPAASRAPEPPPQPSFDPGATLVVEAAAPPAGSTPSADAPTEE